MILFQNFVDRLGKSDIFYYWNYTEKKGLEKFLKRLEN